MLYDQIIFNARPFIRGSTTDELTTYERLSLQKCRDSPQNLFSKRQLSSAPALLVHKVTPIQLYYIPRQ